MSKISDEKAKKQTKLPKLGKAGIMDILAPVDWTQVPIPEEIEDLDKYLGDNKLPELSEELREKYTPFIKDLVKAVDEKWTSKELNQKMTELRRTYKVSPRQSDLIETYRFLRTLSSVPENLAFERIIRKKFNRSTSGVVVITTLLGPGKFSCPMDCHYCPNDPSISRSYLLKEPAVRRGFFNGWDAVRQFMDCAIRLDRNGHPVTKVEIIIEGGTFGSYPHDYIEEYFRDLYYAANIFGGGGGDPPLSPPSLEDENNKKGSQRGLITPSAETENDQKVLTLDVKLTPGKLRPRLSLERELEINQTSKCAIIGITIETRPDWIHKKEILRLRRLGVTRVQLGIQHLDDDILNISNRKCPTKKTHKAISLLKKNGFKVDGHFMPDLPGSNYEKDMEMFKFLFSPENTEVQCDQLKVYPTMALDYTKILEWLKDGTYQPYAQIDNGKWMDNLMNYISLNINPWIRLNRMVRDMPMDYSHGGIQRPNLRQDIEDKLRKNSTYPHDIRGREVKGKSFDAKTARLWIDNYVSSGGQEYFISYENADRTVLYGFVRLRLDPLVVEDEKKSFDNECFFDCLQSAALIRELHVYGELVHQNQNNTGTQTQHLGIGRLLMHTAEKIAWEAGYRKTAVISGVGVRGYYYKLGYRLIDTYMVKTLHSQENITKLKTIAPEESKSKATTTLQKTTHENDLCLTPTTFYFFFLIVLIVIRLLLSIPSNF